MKKLYWWWGSVQGLRTHVNVFRRMHELAKQVPPEAQVKYVNQLRRQEAMVGHCLLHVLLVYPPGSGAMFDEDEWK